MASKVGTEPRQVGLVPPSSQSTPEQFILQGSGPHVDVNLCALL